VPDFGTQDMQPAGEIRFKGKTCMLEACAATAGGKPAGGGRRHRERHQQNHTPL